MPSYIPIFSGLWLYVSLLTTITFIIGLQFGMSKVVCGKPEKEQRNIKIATTVATLLCAIGIVYMRWFLK